MGCRGAAAGLFSALPQHSSSSIVPIPMPSSNPISITGAALEEVTLGLLAKGALELAPLPSPGFYSHLFVVWKTSGSWRPVIALSHLNRFVDVSHFQMETIQSVLLSVRQGDWMASIDLKEAYLQVPVHPASRHSLRFMFRGTVYQFKALCFGLYTAPQVFPRVMAPVSAILHSLGIRMRRYLADWLVQSSSRESLLEGLQTVLQLCQELGIVINPMKSNLIPSQVVQYLGVVIDSTSFRASPSVERILRLHSTAAEFQSCASPTTSLWLSLLGVSFFAGSPRSWWQTGCGPSSSASIVLGTVRIWRLQCWCRWSVFSISSGGSISLVYLSECLSARCLQTYTFGPTPQTWDGVPISVVRSLPACGPPTRQRCLSTPGNCSLFSWGFFQFRSALQGRTVAVFCDNTTAVAYLRKAGGTRSPLLNTLDQVILRWMESLCIRLAPQFLPGSNNVLADALSRPHQLPHTEWSLHMTIFLSLGSLWPVQIVLFATSANHRCSIYFSHFRDPMSAGTDAFLQSWEGLQAYAFPPVAIVPRVLATLRASTGTELTLVAPHWAQCPWFSDLLQFSLAPPVVLPARHDLLHLPRSCHLSLDISRLRLHA